MGLVVQSPGDALLALIAGPSGEGAAEAAPAEGGIFATLMASLFSDGTTEGGEGEGESEGSGQPIPATPEPESKTTNEAALALLTATALLQMVPQSTTPTASTPSLADGSTEAIVPGAETVVVAVLPLDAPAGAEARDRMPIEAASASQEVPVAEPTPTVAAPAESSAPAMEVERAVAPVASRVERPSEAASSDDQAVDAPEQAGVVRAVGNAETSNDATSSEGDGPSTEGSPSRRPERVDTAPRASAQGVENASANSPVGQMRATSQATPLAEVPAPATPAPAELPQQVDQVAASVFESVEVGASEAVPRLDPAEMGEVVIRIQSDADGVRIDIRAERPEAMQLLRDHTQDLSQLLGDRGLNLSDVNVGLGRRDNEQAGGGQQQGNGPADGEFAEILGLDEPGSANLHKRLRSAYNPDGAHMYRV